MRSDTLNISLVKELAGFEEIDIVFLQLSAFYGTALLIGGTVMSYKLSISSIDQAV